MQAKVEAARRPRKAQTLAQAIAKQAARPGPVAARTEPGREAPPPGPAHAFSFHGGPAGGGPGAAPPATPRKSTTLRSLASGGTAGGAPATPRKSTTLRSLASGAGAGTRPRLSVAEEVEEAGPPPPPSANGRATVGPAVASPHGSRVRSATARSPPRKGQFANPLKARTAPVMDNSPGADSSQSTASPASPWFRKQQSSMHSDLDQGSPHPDPDQGEAEGISVRSGMKATRTNASNANALAPALGPKNAFFGASERMEPTKWQRWSNMVDRQSFGAHYQYIVGELSAAHAIEDPEQREHDEIMADGLHKKRPEDPVHPRAGSPKPPVAAAFSDRALRLREGLGARAAMMPQDGPPLTERGCHGDCSSPVCCPRDAKAAGQPSHEMLHNTVPRCAKDGPPSVPHWEPSTSLTLQSGAFARSVPHLEGNPEALPADEERAFHQNLGRKAKAAAPAAAGSGGMLLHKSFSVNDIHVRCAGDYNQELAAEISLERSMGRQAWEGRAGERSPRHGAAFALSPMDSDPPAPTQICTGRKGPGVFKDGFTEEAARFTTHFNQEVHRFADAGLPRGRSQPPPRPDRATAGAATGEWGNHMWGGGNPVTMQGKDQTPRALSSMGRPRGNLTHRANAGNRSDLMARTINQDVCDRYFAALTTCRRQNEPEFAALCALTQNTSQWDKTAAEAIKHRNGHGTSSHTKTSLQWIEE